MLSKWSLREQLTILTGCSIACYISVICCVSFSNAMPCCHMICGVCFDTVHPSRERRSFYCSNNCRNYVHRLFHSSILLYCCGLYCTLINFSLFCFTKANEDHYLSLQEIVTAFCLSVLILKSNHCSSFPSFDNGFFLKN